MIGAGMNVGNWRRAVDKALRFVHNFWGRVYPGWSMVDGDFDRLDTLEANRAVY